MNHSKNEKGYSLLITLLTIALISTIFLMFSLGTFTQQKQVDHTDSSITATNVAEMGVEFYRAKLLNQLKVRIDELHDIVNNLSKVESEFTKSKLEEAEQKELEKYREFITGLQTEKEISLSDDFNNVKFQVSSIGIENNIASFMIKGFYNDTEDTIKVDYKIPSELLAVTVKETVKEENNNQNDLVFKRPDFANTLPNPYPPNGLNQCQPDKLTSTSCKSENMFDFGNAKKSNIYFVNSSLTYHPSVSGTDYNNSNIYFKNASGSSIDTGDFKRKNYSIYANKDINFQNISSSENALVQTQSSIRFGSAENVSNLKLYAQNKLGFWGTLSGTNIHLYSKKAEFGTIKNLYNSQVNVEDSTQFSGAPLSEINNSAFYFNQDVTFNRGVNNVKNNSLIVINRDAFIQGGLEYLDNSNFFVKGEASICCGINNINNDSLIVINGIANFRGPLEKVNNSDVFVNNSATFCCGINNINDNSIIVVNGEATLNNDIYNINNSSIYLDTLNTGNRIHTITNSKICIRTIKSVGSITINKDGSSYLYYMNGNISESNNRKIKVTKEKFNEVCTFPAVPKFPTDNPNDKEPPKSTIEIVYENSYDENTIISDIDYNP